MHTHSDSSPAFKFTSIPAPIPALGVKNAASSYARSDAQSVFHTSKRKPDVEFDARNTAQKQELAQQLKEERTALNGTARDGDTEMANGTKGQPEASTSKHSPTAAEELKAAPNEPGSRTIVLQLGSSQARIGLASQSGPTCIPFVVARPSNRAQEFPPLHADLEDPALDSKIDTMRVELRSRMRSFKLRGTTNGQGMAKEFNDAVTPETLTDPAEEEEPFWINPQRHGKSCIVGEEALRIANAASNGYVLQWPFFKGTFNSSAPYYDHSAQIIADIEDILISTLLNYFDIKSSSFYLYNIVLLAPDSTDYIYLRHISNLLMHTLGFRAIMVQNESVAAALGSGLSTACVVDLGASSIRIGCVEDGWLMPDTRLTLNYGGDDMTMFMFEEFRRAAFPYKEATLSNVHDWYIIQSLKEQVAALGEANVSMSTHHFEVRRINQPTLQYSVKFYDEPVLGSMLLFAPRVVDFDRKVSHPKALWPVKDAVEEGLEWSNEPTLAMKNSVVIHPSASAASAQAMRTQSPHPDGLDISAKSASPAPQAQAAANLQPSASAPPEGVDFARESGKLPLDLAIVESLAASNSEDRVKKFCGAIVLTGGMANLHNVAWGISSRLSGHLSQRYPSLSASAINIVPAPLDLDPSHLAWKGASVLSRIDVSNDMWVRADEYERLDFRAVRERSTLPI